MHAPTHRHLAPRIEDDNLIRGRGRFVDDVERQGIAHAVFVRSPHAHAVIRAISTDNAAGMPGVIGIITAADLAGIETVTRFPPNLGPRSLPIAHPHYPVLADRKVMHVGQAVAMIVAESLTAALDAAEQVAVDYEELPAAANLQAATQPGAPQLFDGISGNRALDWSAPEGDAANAGLVEQIMRSAARIVRVTVTQQRVLASPMETRGGTASFDAESGRYTLRVCSQGAGPVRGMLAAIMRIDKEKLHVITEDVGGAFGVKTGPSPEYPALLVAAKRFGRTIHWMSSRSEAFNSDNQARDSVTTGELAVGADGKFLALRVRHVQNLGAFIAYGSINLAINNFPRCFPGMYDIPRLDIGVQCVYTNTIPTGPYRGAGRPEANYLIERLVEEAARVSGIDPVTIRKRNLIRPAAIPYRTAVGATYDSGEFPAIFDKALALSDFNNFKRRRRESKARGRLRGIGVSCFLEHSGGMANEGAALTFSGDGTLIVNLSVHSTGQGHATVFSRLAAEKLGVDAARIRHRNGDSDLSVKGWMSVASRSTATAGSAVVRTVEAMLEKGRKLAAHVLEANEEDIGYEYGTFKVVGTDRGIGLFELATVAAALKAKGEIDESLDTRLDVDTPQTFPNGCHIAEVEVEPETGTVSVVGYFAVDDCGTMLDARLVQGQMQGGIVQGLGQALLERAVYDDATGQLVTGSFMDYAMPRATDVPALLCDDAHPVPATTNPLGAKGVGEAGAVASLAAIMNAIADAVPAAANMDMPATAEKVWRACRDGGARVVRRRSYA